MESTILHRQRSIRHRALFKVRFAVFVISLNYYLTLLGQGLFFLAQNLKFDSCTISGNFDVMIEFNLINVARTYLMGLFAYCLVTHTLEMVCVARIQAIDNEYEVASFN
jgi:hypothetical protein